MARYTMFPACAFFCVMRLIDAKRTAKLKGYGSINCLDPKNVGLILPLVWIFGAYIDAL